MLNRRFQHKVCAMQITQKQKMQVPLDGYGKEARQSGGDSGSKKVLSGNNSSFENSSEDMDELKRIHIKVQKAIFVHSRQTIRVKAEVPNLFLYTIQEREVTREEEENNMTRVRVPKAHQQQQVV